jgi:ribokinase
MACQASSSTSGSSKPIVVVGSVNADLVVKVQQLPRPGETIAGSSLDFFPGGKVRLASPCCAKLPFSCSR